MHSEKQEATVNGASRSQSAESAPTAMPKVKAQKFSSASGAANRGSADRRSDGSAAVEPLTRHRRVSVRRMRGVPTRALQSPANVPCSAASVDATGSTVVVAAHSAAAGTVREACAEVALKAGNPGPRIPSEIVPEATVPTAVQVRRRTRKLPEYAGSFTDEVQRWVDLVEIQAALLNSKDEKIKQRSLERLLEMKYGKGSEPAEEPPQIVIDVARPNRIPKKEMEEK